MGLVPLSWVKQGLWVRMLLIWWKVLQDFQEDTGALHIYYLDFSAPSAQWFQPCGDLDSWTLGLLKSLCLFTGDSHKLIWCRLWASRSLKKTKKKSRVFFILSLPLSQDRAHLLLISVPVKGIFLSLKYSPNFCPAGLTLPLQLIIVYISRHREQCCIDNEGFFCLLKAILKPPLSPVSFLLSSTDFPSRIYFLGPFVAFPGSPITPYFFLGGAQLLLKAAMCCLKSNNFTPRTSSHIFQKFILWSVTAFKHPSGMLLLQ